MQWTIVSLSNGSNHLTEKRKLPKYCICCFIYNIRIFVNNDCSATVIDSLIVEELTENSFDKAIDYALFSADGGTSLKFTPIAEQKCFIVIDNSNAWRMFDDIDLVVPEFNLPTLKRKIIANPNC